MNAAEAVAHCSAGYASLRDTPPGQEGPMARLPLQQR
jgi:hypothetical protein